MGWLFPIYGKITHVPNHQPGFDLADENRTNMISWELWPRNHTSWLEIGPFMGLNMTHYWSRVISHEISYVYMTVVLGIHDRLRLS